MNRNLDDTELTRRIAGAYARLPEPESARLNAIEERVLRSTARRNEQPRRAVGWYWWLLAALAGVAAASWWAGEYFIQDARQIEQAAPQAPAAVERRDDAPASAPPAKPNANGSGRTPPTIYRKE